MFKLRNKMVQLSFKFLFIYVYEIILFIHVKLHLP